MMKQTLSAMATITVSGSVGNVATDDSGLLKDLVARYKALQSDHKRGAMEVMENCFPGKSPANFHNTPANIDLRELEKVPSIQ